jgi:hypothetical protein
LGHGLNRQASRPEIQKDAAIVVFKFDAREDMGLLTNVTATFFGRTSFLSCRDTHIFPHIRIPRKTLPLNGAKAGNTRMGVSLIPAHVGCGIVLQVVHRLQGPKAPATGELSY